MNRVVPIASLCVALLALAVGLWPREPVATPQVAEAPRGDDDSAELRKRVEQLEDDHRALWDRLAMLERRPQGGVLVADAGVVAAPELASEVTRLREEVRSVMVGEVLSSEAGRTALKDVLREVEADRQRERVVLQQQRQQQRAAEQKVKWKEFVTTAKLTWAQEQELTKRLEVEDAARKALTQRLESGGAPPSRDEFRKLRETQRETDQKMSALLDDSQKQAYEAVRREERGGGGRGGGGRGGGQ